jgi:hypothetical protein
MVIKTPRTMNKLIVILALLLSACAGLGTFKPKPQLYAGKFTGDHASLASCVINKLRSDTRWVINGLGYDVRRYPDIEATEVYAYPLGLLPGMYARNLPTNPDAVGIYAAPVPKVRAYAGSTYTGPDYSFLLMIKRTDNESVRATLRGNEYEGSIAWESLKACSSPLPGTSE